jgi:iron complex transport system substrate-binding protein
MGLCTDQLVMLLANPDQIVSVHWVTQDPEDSAMAAEAQRYVANHGEAEEILALQPDLVFAGTFNSPFALKMLRAQGVRVVTVPAAEDFDSARRNIRTVAAAVGHPERGEAMVRNFDAALARTKNILAASDQTALVYGANGYSAGEPSLFNDVLEHLGLTNVAAGQAGLGWVKMSIEAVVEAQPDILVLGQYRQDAPSQANAVLQHPALQHIREGRPVINIPTTLWNCESPLLAEAAEILAEQAAPRAAALDGK